MSLATAYPVLPVQHSLAHASIDPLSLVVRAQGALGWSGSDFVVGLRGRAELMETLDAAHDLDGLIRVGDPTSPPLRLLRALNASATGLRVTRVAAVPAPWRWARTVEGGTEITGVALRQQAYSDVVSAIGGAGVTFRVLPDHTTSADLLATAAELGSAILDVDEVPDPALVVRGFLDDAPDLAYGLVSRETPTPVDAAWLSMTPARESAGTLMTALQQVSDLGIDLDFLHSDPVGEGRHDFYVGFRADAEALAALQERLAEVHFASRVLAAYAGLRA